MCWQACPAVKIEALREELARMCNERKTVTQSPISGRRSETMMHVCGVLASQRHKTSMQTGAAGLTNVVAVNSLVSARNPIPPRQFAVRAILTFNRQSDPFAPEVVRHRFLLSRGGLSLPIEFSTRPGEAKRADNRVGLSVYLVE